MLNKNKLIISSFLLISTIAFTQQPSFANDDSNVKKVNVEEKEKTNDSVVNSGILKDINIKFHDEIVKDTLKFKVTNEKDGTFFDYTSIDGKLTGVKVIAGEKYKIELLENDKFIMKSMSFSVKFDNVMYAISENGEIIEFLNIDKKSEIVDENLNGWKKVGSVWKYYEKGIVKKGWIFDKEANSWYYTDKEGVRVTGLIYDNEYDAYFFLNDDGKMKIGWMNLNGKEVYFTTSGAMAKSKWVQDNNKWYYFNENGEALKSQWLKYKNYWYYLNNNGVMQTSWKYINNKWYYFDSDGSMATGWKYLSGTWYYLESSGAMATGWKYLGGTWYYLKSSGAMATGWIYDGKWYYLNSGGSWNRSGISYGDWYVLNGRFRKNDGSRSARVGSDYIIVSLSQQRLWLVRNNDLIMNVGIVSGKPSTPTVLGNYHIQYKERNRYLRGDDYKVWVDYWMPFYWGYGIHDASWHRTHARFENPNSYKYYGSHGCVNIFTGDMPKIYSNSYVGMPVIVIP